MNVFFVEWTFFCSVPSLEMCREYTKRGNGCIKALENKTRPKSVKSGTITFLKRSSALLVLADMDMLVGSEMFISGLFSRLAY